MGKILLFFTRGFTSGITLARITIKKILSNLYISNPRPSTAPLIYDGDYPHLFPHAYGEALDTLAFAFGLTRNVDEGDEDFRRRILFSIGQNSTPAGIKRSVERLFEYYHFPIHVDVINNNNYVSDATSTTLDLPIRDPKGSLLYGFTVIITVPTFEGAEEVRDAHGVITHKRVQIINYLTNQKEEFEYPVGAAWQRTANIYVERMITSYRLRSLRELVQGLAASGIRIEKVIIEEGGAGGSKKLT